MKKCKKFTLISTLATLTIPILHFTNKFIFYSSAKDDLLYKEEAQYYNWRFGKIHYTKVGHGFPLLLIHDLNYASSSFEWKKLIHDLSTNFTVFTIDLLGCGKSEKPKMTYTNYLYVQLITDFIKNVIQHKTSVIASGKSVSFITMACYIDPKLFNKLIFINPERIADMNKYPTYKHKLLRYFIDIPIIGTTFYNMVSRRYTIRKRFENNYFYNHSLVYNKYVAAYHESAHLGGSSAKYFYASLKGHYTNNNIVHAIKEINNSIYLIFGENYENWRVISNEYIRYNPSIEVETIEESKYMPQLEKAKECANICNIFLF